MNDIRPSRPMSDRPSNSQRPVRPPVVPSRKSPLAPTPITPIQSQPAKRPLNPVLSAPPVPKPTIADIPPPSLALSTKPKKKRRVWLWVVSMFLAVIAGIAGIAAGTYWWYGQALQPVDAKDSSRVRVEIASGTAPSEIGRMLEEKKLIRSQYAFEIYTRLSDTRSRLQAGTYSLSSSESMEAIVKHLVSGNVDQFRSTFLPGATLAENRQGLIKAGYSEAEVDAALNKTYTHSLFKDKPADSDLEGYIYGETYNFATSATVEDILLRTFDQFYSVITQNNLEQGFRNNGLNLYEGITLASVIQREEGDASDQKQVAQVFYSRLAIDMPLGSDVTYQYAAKKMGVTPSPLLDSPYNTRKYPGLPPGPIATPGFSSLAAVAKPASGDFLYFVSGDDGKTHFSHTNEQHEENVRLYCHQKCLIP